MSSVWQGGQQGAKEGEQKEVTNDQQGQPFALIAVIERAG